MTVDAEAALIVAAIEGTLVKAMLPYAGQPLTPALQHSLGEATAAAMTTLFRSIVGSVEYGKDVTVEFAREQRDGCLNGSLVALTAEGRAFLKRLR